MRDSVLVSLLACSVAPLIGQTPDAEEVLSAARQALGGEKRLSAVKTFSATGRTRQVRGNTLVPIDFEIACEWPDKYVRTEDVHAQGGEPSSLGFNGDELLQFPLRGTGRSGAPGAGPPPAAESRSGGPPAGRSHSGAIPPIVAVKQEFARLMLGMFAASSPGFPLTFQYAAVGEGPDGTADILAVSGPTQFSVRFVVRHDTHLPVMLTWDAPPPGQRKPVEHRMYFADFRDVDGLKLPFHIRHTAADDTIEEFTFDRIQINVKIDQRKFEIKK